MNEEKMFGLVALTFVLVLFVGAWLFCEAWRLGRDFIIDGNYGKRLNFIEKWFDGLITLLKI